MKMDKKIALENIFQYASLQCLLHVRNFMPGAVNMLKNPGLSTSEAREGNPTLFH